MATVSRQSAFWAVVALGLNTFVQAGSKVLGFPADWSRALRLSPIVCIVDTLGVLFSIAFFSYQTGSFKDGFRLAARYRCLTEDDPAEPKLERTWWFRLSVFAVGAMPQALKVMGMGGIPLTKTWEMAYLVSFLVIEGFDLLQPRQHGDDHALQHHAAVLDTYIYLLGCLAVFAPAMYLMAEVFIIPMACYLGPSNFLLLPDLRNVTNAMTTLIEFTPYWLLVLLSPFVLNRATSLLFELIPGRSLTDSVVIQMCVFLLVATTYLVGLVFVLNRQEASCLLGKSSEAVALALLLTFFACVFICTEMATKFWWFRKLFGLKRYERREGSFPLTFIAGNIAGIICYYVYIYDPSSTYKPSWTEYLG